MTVRFRAAVGALVLGVGVAMATPGVAVADPVVETTPVEVVPAAPDAQLRAAIATLSTRHGPEIGEAIKAALALFKGVPRNELSAPVPIAAADPVPAADPSPADYAALLKEANDSLVKLGIQPALNPSFALNCTAPTADNPLGVVPGVAGAVPGPWPSNKLPSLKIPGVTKDAVNAGEVLFGFVPVGLDKDNGGAVQVAWFNIKTFQGGFVTMKDAATTLTDTMLKGVPAGIGRTLAEKAIKAVVNSVTVPGTRLAPVKTGEGTVLSATFGTVKNGANSCFFFPMLAITEV